MERLIESTMNAATIRRNSAMDSYSRHRDAATRWRRLLVAARRDETEELTKDKARLKRDVGVMAEEKTRLKQDIVALRQEKAQLKRDIDVLTERLELSVFGLRDQIDGLVRAVVKGRRVLDFTGGLDRDACDRLSSCGARSLDDDDREFYQDDTKAVASVVGASTKPKEMTGDTLTEEAAEGDAAEAEGIQDEKDEATEETTGEEEEATSTGAMAGTPQMGEAAEGEETTGEDEEAADTAQMEEAAEGEDATEAEAILDEKDEATHEATDEDDEKTQDSTAATTGEGIHFPANNPDELTDDDAEGQNGREDIVMEDAEGHAKAQKTHTSEPPSSEKDETMPGVAGEDDEAADTSSAAVANSTPCKEATQDTTSGGDENNDKEADNTDAETSLAVVTDGSPDRKTRPEVELGWGETRARQPVVTDEVMEDTDEDEEETAKPGEARAEIAANTKAKADTNEQRGPVGRADTDEPNENHDNEDDAANETAKTEEEQNAANGVFRGLVAAGDMADEVYGAYGAALDDCDADDGTSNSGPAPDTADEAEAEFETSEPNDGEGPGTSEQNDGAASASVADKDNDNDPAPVASPPALAGAGDSEGTGGDETGGEPTAVAMEGVETDAAGAVGPCVAGAVRPKEHADEEAVSAEEDDPMEEDSLTAFETQAFGLGEGYDSQATSFESQTQDFVDTQETEGSYSQAATLATHTSTSTMSTGASRRQRVRRRSRRYSSSPKKWRRMIRTRRLQSILLAD